MSRRTVYSLVNVAVLGSAVVVLFFLPAYSAYALFALLGWLAAGLTLAWSGWTTGATAIGAAVVGGPVGPDGALDGSAARPVPSIDFCIYCGTRFGPGERTCGSCGHMLPRNASPA